MKKIILAFVLLIFIITSCMKGFDDKKIKSESENLTMNDLIIDDDFNWKTTKDIDVILTGTSKNMVSINATDGHTYHKGMLFASTDYTTKITIPAYVTEVELVYNGQRHKVIIESNKIKYNFK